MSDRVGDLLAQLTKNHPLMPCGRGYGMGDQCYGDDRSYWCGSCERLSQMVDLANELEAELLALSHAAGQECTCPSGDGSLRWPCPAHPSGQEVVAWRDEDFVLMPRSLSPASLERMAHFDFDDVGNSYADAADELWGELIDNEAKDIQSLEFSNPVFHAGNNTTVRRGLKWYGTEYARLALGSETVIVRLSSMTQRFCYLTDHYLRDEHDPSCRTVAGLLAEMKRVYPGFSEYEDVTLVNFTLPEYTHPRTCPSGEVSGLERIDGMEFWLHENVDDGDADPVRLVMAMSHNNKVFCHRAAQADNGICASSEIHGGTTP